MVFGVWCLLQGGVYGLLGSGLLSAVGIALGAGMSLVLMDAFPDSRFPRRFGLAAIVVSQGSFLVMVWFKLTTHQGLWRMWWLATGVSMILAHRGFLCRRCQDRWSLLDRLASRSSLFAGLVGVTLGLRPNLLEDPLPGLGEAFGVGSLAALILTILVWRRACPPELSLQSLWIRTRCVLLPAAFVSTFSVGLYFGRASVPATSAIDALPSMLRGIAPDELDRQIEEDFRRLETLQKGLKVLLDEAGKYREGMQARLKAEGRAYYLPEEDNQIRSTFLSYLSYRTGLLRILASYSGFQAVFDASARARCFLLAYLAALSVYQGSMTLVTAYKDDKPGRRKLNEPAPTWGIPAGMFDRVYEKVVSEQHMELAVEMATHYLKHRSTWQQEGVWPPDRLSWVYATIDAGIGFARRQDQATGRARMDLMMSRVASDAYTPVYAIQSLISEWVGDTRLSQREPFISFDQIESAESQMRPGDIILERRTWFLSNAFLPGFWPHSALYVGRYEDLQRMGIADRPEIVKHLEAYREKSHDGRDRTVLESVSEGVVFNSTTHSMHADYVAVLRPRLDEKQIGESIVRAFTHVGKPYDFEFDLFSSDKLICTELIYQAYEGMIHFDLTKVMGKDTLTVVEILQKFIRERDTPDQQLEFVFFLDGSPGTGKADLASEDSFCESARRPRGYHE